MTPIEVALWLLLLHGGLGAIDTFFHHEWLERLPERPFAATELALHAARSLSFVLIFSGLAWLEWRGTWGWVVLVMLGVEGAVTIADSVVEDRTRVLQPSERINHMLLAFNTGAYSVLVAWQVAGRWRHEVTALVPTRYPALSELLTACAFVVAIWACRDAAAARHLRRRSYAAEPVLQAGK